MDQTDADLIKKYVEIRDFLEKKSTEFGEQMKPYQAALDSIGGEMLSRLNERDAQNCKTEFGTAFKKTDMSVRMADRETFFHFLLEPYEPYIENAAQEIAFDEMRQRIQAFTTAHLAKDAVKEYLDGSAGQPPPGVDVTYFTKVNIRRS